MDHFIAVSLQQVITTILGMAVGIGLIEGLIYLIWGRIFKHENTLVVMLITPALIGLMLLIVYPLIYEVTLAFSNMNLYHFKDPDFGLGIAADNFKRLFTQPVLQQATFFPIMFRTFLWTGIQILFHTVFGMILALLLNQPKIRFKSLYKTFLILPWAIPQVISCLTWRGEFHYEFGLFNILLTRMGLEAIQWKADPIWNYIAMNMTNIWLGIPFMMVIFLGGLQSISHEYYEAADIDGATSPRKFFNITLPLMKPVMVPAVMLGIIWTFNNFNIPFFINEMKLETSDILVTGLFRAAFTFNQYGFAAAFALVIFAILFMLSLWYVKVTGALKGVNE